MKKLSIFAAMLLSLSFTACVDGIDNPVNDDGKQTISLDGVNYKADLLGTFTGEIGTEVSIGLGCYAPYNVYGVDFGDGNIKTDTVGWHNGGVRIGDGETPAEKEGTTHKSMTKFVGTIAGDGIIKVYGNSDVWAANLEGGIVPTSLDQEHLQNIHELTISGAKLGDFAMPELTELTQLSISNSELTSLDVSGLAALRILNFICTNQSEYEPQLASIDVSNNYSLEQITLGGAYYKPGILTALDLSNNSALTLIVVSNNKISDLKLPAGANITQLSADVNELEALDLSVLGSVKNVQVNDNKLTAIDLSKLVAAKNTLNLYNNLLTELTIPVDVKTVDAKNNKLEKVEVNDVTSKLALEKNKLAFSSLPTKPASLKANKYTYAPQDITLAIALDFVGAADLTAEYGPFKGVAAETEETNLTTYTFKADGVDVPEENYKAENGKITFLHVYDKIVGYLNNPAFPDLTLTTTEFYIRTYGTGAYQVAYTYDFAAAEAAGENPTNFNGNQSNGQGFYGWETAEKTDSRRNDYKGYVWAEGSVLPKECHVYRRSDRINGNIKNGGLYCPSDKEMAIDGLDVGYIVEIFYDASNAADGSKEMIWAIGDGTSEEGGAVRATAIIGGIAAETGKTAIPSGTKIEVLSVTPAVKGSGYIVFKVKKNMVITKIVITKPTE